MDPQESKCLKEHQPPHFSSVPHQGYSLLDSHCQDTPRNGALLIPSDGPLGRLSKGHAPQKPPRIHQALRSILPLIGFVSP